MLAQISIAPKKYKIGGEMLTRAIKTIFLILVSFLWHSVATAQSPMQSFSYAEKSEAIQLAKAGDAEALYKLGVSYLYGVNATQNLKVAERFFFYSAEKGHVDAKSYLAKTKEIARASVVVAPPKRLETLKPIDQNRNAVRKNKSGKVQKNKIDREKRLTQRKKRAQEKKRAKEKQAAQKKKAELKKKRAQKIKDAQKRSSLNAPVGHRSARQRLSAETSFNELSGAVATNVNSESTAVLPDDD